MNTTVMNYTTQRYRWGVSVTTSSSFEGARLNVYTLLNGRVVGAGCDGRMFASSAQAFAFALEHGFLRTYHSRPNGFVWLRLPKRLRQHVKPMERAARVAVVMRVLGGVENEFLRTVFGADYMEDRRQEWQRYMDGQQVEYKNRRKV